MPERDQDVAQVLAVPRRRPGGDRPLADGERGVGNERLLGHFVDAAEAVAVRARALRCVGREVLGIEHRLARRIAAGARIEQAQEARQRRHAADRRACAGRAALLLQCDRGRQAGDRIDVGNADLVDQPARVRRDRFEVAPLRLGVQRAEGKRRLARTRDAREHDQRVARNIDVDVLQVVLACTAHANEPARVLGGRAHTSASPQRARPASGARAARCQAI